MATGTRSLEGISIPSAGDTQEETSMVLSEFSRSWGWGEEDTQQEAECGGTWLLPEMRHQRLSSSLRAPTGASCCLSPTQRKSVKDPTWFPTKELASTGQECRIDLEVRTTGWGTKQKARTLYLGHICELMILFWVILAYLSIYLSIYLSFMHLSAFRSVNDYNRLW